MALLYDDIGKNGMGAELSDAAKESITAMLEGMKPQREELERIAEEYRQAGEEVPANIREGLANMNQLEAMTQGTEGMFALLGTGLAESEGYQEVLETASASGESLNATMAEAISLSTGQVYDAQTKSWQAVSSAGEDASEDLLAALNANTELANNEVIQGLIGSYGLIKSSATGSWVQIKDAAYTNQDDIKAALSTCGMEASNSLIQSILDKEPDVRGQAVDLLRQLQLADEEKRPEILNQLMGMGIQVDDSLAQGIASNIMPIRNQTESAVIGLRDAAGNKIRNITPEFAKYLADMGLIGVDDMETVIKNSNLNGPEVTADWSETARRGWNSMQRKLNGLPPVQIALSAAVSQVRGYATGGIVTERQIAQVAEEAPGEAIIPLSPARRSRALSLWEETGVRLGVDRAVIATLNKTAKFGLQKNSGNMLQVTGRQEIDYERLGKEVAEALRKSPLEIEKIEVQNQNVLSVELDGETIGKKTAPTVSRILSRYF